MNREEFIRRYRHEILGLIADCLSRKNWSEMGMYWELAGGKVHELLQRMYLDAATAPAEQPKPLPSKK